jgi:quinol-cytochrome oxidoreductase complex cytochrome b subunit
MLLVPGAIIALIGAHLYLVVKLGTTAPPWVKAERPKLASPVTELEAGAENGRVNGHANGYERVDGSDGAGGTSA